MVNHFFKMKKGILRILSFAVFVLMLSSCGQEQSGELIGAMDRPGWSGINPYGMVYIPSGTLHMGGSDQDVFSTYTQKSKSISIQGFYMDDTEITNNEYRQFVEWVRDSIAHVYMDDIFPDEYTDEDRVDWEMELDYSDETLDDMFYEGDQRINGKRELDPRELVFTYQSFDWQRAAHDKSVTNRNELITDHEIEVYPDTLAWIRDFSYSYNEPMTRNYFWHPAFDEYPVVGVNWNQATAFCYWRSKLWDMYKSDEPNTEEFRLPSEAEWEHAARGGHDLAPYPWGGYYVRNAKGCLLANFKPGRGNYPEDGGQYTVKADAYFPNDYGLYCMAGNVAEWTGSAYADNAYTIQHDLNPDYRYNAKESDDKAYKRKVIRGGSWKDISYYLQTGTRHWEYQDTSKSYIGFRCVLTFLGRSANDF